MAVANVDAPIILRLYNGMIVAVKTCEATFVSSTLKPEFLLELANLPLTVLMSLLVVA